MKRSGTDLLLDVVLYAPLGAALSGPELVDELAARGRQQVKNARALGEVALQRGSRRVGEWEGSVGSLLSEALAAAARAAGAPLAGSESSSQGDTGTGGPGEPTARSPGGARLSVVAVQLPIHDYDSLSASQVVPRLAGLSPPELEAVWEYESSHRGRRTILSQISRLRAS